MHTANVSYSCQLPAFDLRVPAPAYVMPYRVRHYEVSPRRLDIAGMGVEPTIAKVMSLA